MKDFYIRDAALYENKDIITSFVVCAKQVKPRKTGTPYLALTLADRSGQIDENYCHEACLAADIAGNILACSIEDGGTSSDGASSSESSSGSSFMATTCTRLPRGTLRVRRSAIG